MRTSPSPAADDEGLLAAPTLALLRRIGQVLPLADGFEKASREVLSRLAGLVPAGAFALAVMAEDERLIFTHAFSSLYQRLTAEIRDRLSEAAGLVLGRKVLTTQDRFEPMTGGSAKAA